MENSQGIREMSYDKLLENYREHANCIIQGGSGVDRFAFIATTYLAEMQRRDMEKTNQIMQRWTIAIGVMTAIMLAATIVNIFI